MLRIDHRESHDIDIFLDDPQLLPFFDPELQSYALSRQPDGSATDGARSLKLTYQDIGEIDFICCTSILDNPSTRKQVRGHDIDLESAAEIIAKKVYFRGGSFQPRDMFDLAAVPFVESIIGQLMVREKTAYLVQEAQSISRGILALAV